MFNNEIFKKIFKPVLIAAILTALSVGVSLYFASRISEISKKAAEKRETLFLHQTSQEQFAALKEDFQSISPHWEKVNKVFPSSENVISFLDAVENLASTTGVQQTFRFESAGVQLEPELNLNKIPFNINVGGTQTQFLEYLKGIEELPYFAKIESVGITSASAIDGQVQANLKGIFYIKP